jgi:cell division protein FtsB
LGLSRSACRAVQVATSIGTLTLRSAIPDKLGKFGELRKSTRGAELWRAHLVNVGSREVPNAAASPQPLTRDEVAQLSDDDLDRAATAYLAEMMRAGDGAAEDERLPPREAGERNSEFLARLLEAEHNEHLEQVRTKFRETFDSFTPMSMLVREDRDGAFAEAQKRVDELQELLEHQDRIKEADSDTNPAEAPGAPFDAQPIPGQALSGEELSRGIEEQTPWANEERRQQMASLADAVKANLQTAALLGGLVESGSRFLVELERAKVGSEAAERRGIRIAIGVLVAACALAGIALVQDYFHQRAQQAWQDAMQAQLSAQTGLQSEVARLQDERASLAARIERLESERNAQAAEAARRAEAPAVAEETKVVKPIKPAAKSSKVAKSLRPAKPAKIAPPG